MLTAEVQLQAAMHSMEQGQALPHPALQRKLVMWGGIHSSHTMSVVVAQPVSSKQKHV